MCFCELANMLARRDSASALHFLRQSLLIFCRLGDSHKEAHCLYEIGRLAASRARDFATAFSYFLQARVIFRQRGDITEDANCSYELGKLAAKARQLSAAVSYFEEVSSATFLTRSALTLRSIGLGSLSYDLKTCRRGMVLLSDCTGPPQARC